MRADCCQRGGAPKASFIQENVPLLFLLWRNPKYERKYYFILWFPNSQSEGIKFSVW